MSDLLENLNPQQRTAVTHDTGPLLIFAGAGSGKTRVITHRIAYLVRERGVPPWNILAVTFTNKAAGEMRSRVGELLGQGLRDTWIGTFHATCARMLRQNADRAGVKRDFVIYDDSDQKAMVTRCVRELGIDDKRFPPRAIQSRINTAKQECVGAEEYQPENYFDDQVRKVYELYEKKMVAVGAVDFGDLLFRVVRLLEQHPQLAEKLQRRFRYLLVDEFQDTNHVQYRLLKLLTGPERNICVVGDDDQSIYRWRGADVRNILGFRKDFPEASVVTLEQNYRSTAHILASAVAVIKRNRTRAPKTLWTDNQQGDLLRLVTLTDEREEASYVVRAIRDELDAGRGPGDIAVFYRINAQARVIEEALRAANVPYRVIGGMKFYERAEIKDLIAYLRVVHNLDNDVDLIRIINNPPRRIGVTTVNRLLDQAGKSGATFWVELGKVVEGEGDWPKATRKRLAGFHAQMLELQELASVVGPAELAAGVLERTKYLETLQNQDSPEAEGRIENLEELLGSFEEFERESEEPSLAALLESISLVQDVDNLDENPQTVTLMTVHGAKGLEFPVVFLTGMEEDIFPYRRVRDEVDEQERREQLEEERRLCYVAITRARERLVLTNVARRRLFGTERFNLTSHFIDDIPNDFLEVTDWAGSHELVPFNRRESANLRRGGDEGELLWNPSGTSTSNRGRRRDPRSSFKSTPGWAKQLELGGTHDEVESQADDGELQVVLDEPVVTYDEAVDGDELRPGMSVRHSKYGVGRVHRVDPGFTPKVVVDFIGVGRKTILARFLHPA